MLWAQPTTEDYIRAERERNFTSQFASLFWVTHDSEAYILPSCISFKLGRHEQERKTKHIRGTRPTCSLVAKVFTDRQTVLSSPCLASPSWTNSTQLNKLNTERRGIMAQILGAAAAVFTQSSRAVCQNLAVCIPVFYVHTSIKHKYTDKCWQAQPVEITSGSSAKCAVRSVRKWGSRQKTSKQTTTTKTSKRQWHFICILDMFEVPLASSTTEVHGSHAYVDWKVTTDLTYLWYLGLVLDFTCVGHVHEKKVVSLPGIWALSNVLSGNDRVYQNQQPYWYTAPRVR